MSKWSDLLGTTAGYLRLGTSTGVRLKNSSGTLLVRNAGDSAYATASVATPTADEHAATKLYTDQRRTYSFPAGALLVPGTGWNTTTAAPSSADSTDTHLTVVRFDDTAAESRGWRCEIPAGATYMALDYVIRAQTAPAGTRTVGVVLAYARFGNSAATESWATYTVGDLSLPATAYFQELSQAFLLTAPSTDLVAGAKYLMQITLHNTPGAGTKLTGDRTLASLGVRFY